jgi:hypothetical protein
MIVFNPLSDHFLFVFGNMKLFGPTISTLCQDKAGVFVSFLTSAIRFSTGYFSESESASDKFLPGDIGFESGTAFAFELSHSGAMHSETSVFYLYYIKDKGKSQAFF